MGKMALTMKFTLPVSIKQKGKFFIACCPVLDVWSQGETLERAQENIIEALELFLSSCFNRGTLDQVLKEFGFVPAKKDRATKLPEGFEIVEVPLPFVIADHLSRCRV